MTSATADVMAVSFAVCGVCLAVWLFAVGFEWLIRRGLQ